MCAEGSPEAWESTLFRASQREAFLDSQRYAYEDDDSLEAFGLREKEIRASWATGQIVAGNAFPPADGTCALLVEKSFGIAR